MDGVDGNKLEKIDSYIGRKKVVGNVYIKENSK